MEFLISSSNVFSHQKLQSSLSPVNAHTNPQFLGLKYGFHPWFFLLLLPHIHTIASLIKSISRMHLNQFIFLHLFCPHHRIIHCHLTSWCILELIDFTSSFLTPCPGKLIITAIISLLKYKFFWCHSNYFSVFPQVLEWSPKPLSWPGESCSPF